MDPYDDWSQYKVWQKLPENASCGILKPGEAEFDPDWQDEARFEGEVDEEDYLTDDDLTEDRPPDAQESDDEAQERLDQYEALWPGEIKTGRNLLKVRYVDTNHWKNTHKRAATTSQVGKAGLKRRADTITPPARKRRKTTATGSPNAPVTG